MIAFKCKMCGGDMELQEGATVVECPYCMTKQTLPKLDNDKRANMYDRANHFRRQNEYDKAMGIFENILQEDLTDAEAYWSLVLCRYGIEYVEDPATHKRIPTVNRVQYTSILADEDYKSALKYADAAQRSVYELESKAIDEIQKGILAISKQEEPFDIFICYKETDANGRRTPDSVLANEIYHQLTKEGYKVFFSRITLEDKIGSAYEPYIFAALNSAKVMIVLGTKPEYFNAVWVKNEWSRYLALIKAGTDKTLVPAYRDMDPYDLPDELSHLQAQDMSKLGFMQDLIRGIKKIAVKEEKKPQSSYQQSVSGVTTESLMKRAKLFLEDGDYTNANEYLDKVLDIDPEYAPAYIGKTQVAVKVPYEKDLTESLVEFENNSDWKKAVRFATQEQRALYEGYVSQAQEKREEKRKNDIYQKAINTYLYAGSSDECYEARELFASIPGYRDADRKQQECIEKARSIEVEKDRIAKETIYSQAMRLMKNGLWKNAISVFETLSEYKDSSELIKQCEKEILEEQYEKAEKLKISGKYAEAIEAYREISQYRDSTQQIEDCKSAQEAEKRAIEEERKKQHELAERKKREAAAKKKRNTILGALAAIFVLAVTFLVTLVIIPGNNYRNAVALQQAGQYEEAITAFEAIKGYGDSTAHIEACQNSINERYYQEAVALQQAGKYKEAIVAFGALDSYSDSETQIYETKYLLGKELAMDGEYAKAATVFNEIRGYKDVDSLLQDYNNLVAADEAKTVEKVEEVAQAEEFVKADMDSPVCIEAYVQANQSWWDGKIKLYLQDENHGAYFAYDLPCTEEEAKKLAVPGTKVRITGVKAEWSGEVEIIDATYEILEGSFIAEPEDVTALFGKDELIDHMNEKIAVKGAKVVAKTIEGQDGEFAFLYAWDGSGSQESNSDLYFDVEIDGKTYSFTVESYLCDNTTDVYKAVEGLKVGDTIDCEGFLYWYNGANPHITAVTVK